MATTRDCFDLHELPLTSCPAPTLQTEVPRSTIDMLAIRIKHHCDHCDKCFARASILRDHKNSVKGIRPHACNFDNCSAAFTRNNDLKVHQRECHSESPPEVPCWGCTKVFKRKSDLNRHLKAPGGRSCCQNISCAIVESKLSPLVDVSLNYDLHCNWNKRLYQSFCAFTYASMRALDIRQGSLEPEIPPSYFDMVRATRHILDGPRTQNGANSVHIVWNSARTFEHPSHAIHWPIHQSFDADMNRPWVFHPPQKWMCNEDIRDFADCCISLTLDLFKSLSVFDALTDNTEKAFYELRLRVQLSVAGFAGSHFQSMAHYFLRDVRWRDEKLWHVFETCREHLILLTSISYASLDYTRSSKPDQESFITLICWFIELQTENVNTLALDDAMLQVLQKLITH